MTTEPLDGQSSGNQSALQRSQAAAGALSVAARQLRFARSRRSKLYEAAGLRPRRIDRVFQALFAMLVTVALLLPNAVSVLYFGFLASDQYQSETRFVVRSSEPVRENDKLAQASGIPSALVAQDTQIIANYVTSRGLIDHLNRTIDLYEIYGRKDIDWYARLRSDATFEDLLDYWEDVASAAIAPASGIVTVKVKAFSAEESHRLTSMIVEASEELVNSMNERIWHDVTGSAEEQVQLATAELSRSREALQAARNKAGILTVDSAANSLSALLTQLQGEKIAVENKYSANLDVVSETAPQMKVMRREIESKQKQIDDLKSQIASTASAGTNLAERSTEFSQIELEQKLAEDRLAASIKTLEQLQYLSQQKLLYLDPFLAPTTPDDAQYPKRFLWIGLVLLGSAALFAVLASILSVVRTRLD